MSISPDWLAAASQCQEAILITVAASKGSVPRAAGAKMVVTRDQQFDTIGGGHLEHQALALARRLLSPASATTENEALPTLPHLQRVVLGASLGQCCGGVVHLLFERLDATTCAEWQAARQRWQAGQDSWRELALDAPAAQQSRQRNQRPQFGRAGLATPRRMPKRRPATCGKPPAASAFYSIRCWHRAPDCCCSGLAMWRAT